MDIKERVIDVREFLLYLWDKKIIIAILTVFFACCAVGLGYWKQKYASGSSPIDGEVASLDDIANQNHDAFYHLNGVSAYTDGDQPLGTYNASIKLYVDFNYSNIEGNCNLDYSQMNYKLQQDALILLVSEESLQKVIDEQGLRNDDDMSNISVDDLKWLINKNFLGANILQIVVTDVDSARAEKIVEALSMEFIEKCQDFDTIDSVEIIDNNGVAIENPKGLEQGMGDCNTVPLNAKKIIKYLIVGAVGGVLLICMLFFLIFITWDSVRNALDVSFADMNVFGYISRKKKKKEEDYKRIAYNVSLQKDCKTILVIPVDPKSDKKEIVDGIRENLVKVNNNIKLVQTKNIKDSADATLSAVDSDAIIILATFGKTRMRDLIFAKNEINKTNTPILGTIITSSR